LKIRFLAPARDELHRAVDYYEEAAEGSGGEFLQAVESTLENLERNPKIGISVDTSLRRLQLVRFPFSLIYSIDPSEIQIIALAHDRREPGYWDDR
jgi:plasmid stabilization system protein ParE